jgi:hypothetical protein
MTTSQVRSSKPSPAMMAGAVVAAALFCLVGVATPAAHADAVDDNFLTAIKAKGINIASPQAAIVAAHEVCDELDLGRQKSDVASEVKTNSNLDDYHAGYFIGVSVKTFCPRHLGQ